MATRDKPTRRSTGQKNTHVPLESSIVDAIMRFLKTVPQCKAEKTHGGAFGRAGKPDITGCLNGRRFEIEVKRPGQKPTEIQKKHLREWEAAGAIVGVAHSVEEARLILSAGLDFRVDSDGQKGGEK
jgi:hypothetical protein